MMSSVRRMYYVLLIILETSVLYRHLSRFVAREGFIVSSNYILGKEVAVQF